MVALERVRQLIAKFPVGVDFLDAILEQVRQLALQEHEFRAWGVDLPESAASFCDLERMVFCRVGHLVQDVCDEFGLELQEGCDVMQGDRCPERRKLRHTPNLDKKYLQSLLCEAMRCKGDGGRPASASNPPNDVFTCREARQKI